MPDYRLIALDLDGTLLNTQKQLSSRNAAALLAAAEQGIHIVPATGRFFDGMPEVIRTLPYLRYAITMNGAQVQNIQTKEVIYRAELPLNRAIEVLEYLDTLPIIYDCYVDNWGWMTRSMKDQAAEYAPNAHYLKMIQDLRTPVYDLKQYLKSRGLDVQKIQAFVKEKSQHAAIMSEIAERFSDIAVSSSITNNVELNVASANKGAAVRALVKHLGLTMEQTVSFGDGSNDLSMIRDCGLGVSMGNGCAAVRNAADRITVSCDEDGVAVVIEELLKQ